MWLFRLNSDDIFLLHIIFYTILEHDVHITIYTYMIISYFYTEGKISEKSLHVNEEVDNSNLFNQKDKVGPDMNLYESLSALFFYDYKLMRLNSFHVQEIP